MANILEKVFPAKKGLAERFESLHQKVDHGGITPAKADLEMATILCREMTASLGEASPRSFSVWLAGPTPSEFLLAGWECPAGECGPPPSKLPASVTEAGRVMGTRRPLVLEEEGKVRELAEKMFPGKRPGPGEWASAVLLPLEKAGEALGLAAAFFQRRLTEPDVEGLMRFCDLLGSYLFTGEDGLAEIPGS